MNVDIMFSQLGLKKRNLVVLDVSFPGGDFLEFKKSYGDRYVHLPCRESMALEYAGGLASLGKVVAVYGLDLEDFDLPDQTLNVKLLRRSDEAVWDYLEGELGEFGPAVLLIPHDE